MALKGRNNEEKIWNFFKSKEFNDYACAGIMGNLQSESGLKSNNLQDTGNRKLGMTDDEYAKAVNDGRYTKEQFIKDQQGYGICQWTFHTRKKALYEFAKTRRISISDLEMQLEFLYKELTEDFKPVFNKLKTATSVSEASNVMLLEFEKPANQSKLVQAKRAAYSQKYYDKYATNGKKDNGDITVVTSPVASTFKMRTTKPEAGNKYYITRANGGWSNAIQGHPKDKDCDVLANCFDGETKFITSEGIKTLRECENQNIKVLSEGGLFRNATVKSFGEQKLYKATFNNGNSYLVTANHRWVVDVFSTWKGKKYHKRKIKTTLELKSVDNIPYEMAQHTFEIDPDGIRHGFIFGDGSYYNKKRHTQANLCGFKRDYMYEWFINSKHINKQKNGTINAYPYPKEYKLLPPLAKGQAYLRGFISGYLASDGCISKDGSIRLDCSKEDVLIYVKNICAIIGIRTSQIKVEYRKGFGKVETPMYHLYMHRETVDNDLLLNPIHKTRFMNVERRNTKFTRIKSIEDTGIVTTVYCVQEPETHTMVLEDNMLTGQCVGFAVGRFNEIGNYNSCKYLTPVNAERFIECKNPELQVGQTPKLGACMVWKGGSTLKGADGAGHVAIVEKVISDTEVYTSESGWGSVTPFWNQTRKKGENGRWGMGSSYTFLGFIYNPAVTNDTKVDNSIISKPVVPTVDSASKLKVESAKSFSKSVSGTYQTVARLNMRNGAGTNKAILVVIPKGGKVTCYGYYTVANGIKWYYVIYKNNQGVEYTGFVSSEYVKK